MTDYNNNEQKKVKVTCSKCGAEFEAPERLAAWFERNPEKKVCSACFSAGAGKKGAKPSGDASKADFKGGAGAPTRSKVVFKPEHFHKIMAEFEAEFGTEFRTIIEAGALGGWVTTVLLSRRDAGLLK